MFARFEKYQRGRHRFLLAAVRTPFLVATPDSDVPMVSRLPRDDLERLLVASVEKGAAISRESCLPASQQTSKPTAAAGNSPRSGTGLFEALDDRILIPMILARLPARDRFTCATSVCASWRSLRDSPALWATLSIDGR